MIHFVFLFQVSYNGGIFVNKSIRYSIRKWEDISRDVVVAIVPYFRDLVFRSSYCRNCNACGLYYRIMNLADVKFLKMFKNINTSKSFVVTWHNVRKHGHETVSYFILVLLFQKNDVKR